MNDMVIWNGPLEEPSGFGTAARDYVKCLHKYGLDIKTNIVKYYSGCSNDLIHPDDVKLMQSLQTTVNRDELNRVVFVNHCTPYEALQSVVMPYVSYCKKKVLYTVWETDRIPDYFKQYFNYYDLVLTASEFSKESFKKTIPELPIEVVPHVIANRMNSNIPRHSKLMELKNQGKKLFFANLEWHIGKGYDTLISGFFDAFEHIEDVILVLKTYNLSEVQYKNSIIDYIKNVKGNRNFPKIIPFIGNMKWKDLMSLYKTIDCYISMSRREAYGLTMAEAFSFGLPIICPDKGGHRQFLNSNNSIMVDSNWDTVNRLETTRSLYSGQKWIESDYDDYISKLRNTYEHLSLHPNRFKKIYKEQIKNSINEFSDKEICRQLVQKLIG